MYAEKMRGPQKCPFTTTPPVQPMQKKKEIFKTLKGSPTEQKFSQQKTLITPFNVKMKDFKYEQNNQNQLHSQVSSTKNPSQHLSNCNKINQFVYRCLFDTAL